MSRKVLGALLIVCGASLAGSCAMDDREIQLVLPNQANAGAAGGGAAALSPRLEVTPLALDLGWVATGYPARARLHLANVGSSPLPVPAVTLAPSSDADFQIIQNECRGEIAPGGACDVRVQLIPSRAGILGAGLNVASADGSGVDVALTGEGVTAGALTLAPASGSFDDFGGVPIGTTVVGVFSVSNPAGTASGPLAFRSNRPEFSVLPSTGEAGECVSGTTSLANGETCNVRIAFTPTQRGAIEAVLTSRSDGAGSVSSSLAGRGLAPGALLVNRAEVDFAGVVLGDGALQGVRFGNAGDEPLTLAGAGLAPAGAEGFTIVDSDCGAGRALAGGESCGVAIEFRPPRSAEEMTAELWADAIERQQRQTVPLRGIGLNSGALLVAPIAAGEEQFGSVLLGGSLVHAFQVTNPTPQPSGVLSVTAGNGFEVLGPDVGECGSGSTSIVDGQSCTVRVTFTPTRRETYQGALTVRSALAGAKSLPLSGRGIIPAALELASEIDFGRVFTNASAIRTLSVRNGGDEPLSPPSLEVVSGDAALAAAFSYQSTCTGALAFGQSCDISVTLTPTRPVPHWANLRLSAAPGGSASVLLLAEALTPGSLVVAAAPGSSADFGDVAIGTSSTREFTLTNPGTILSGRLTLRADDNRFEVLPGDCDPLGLAADGGACSFGVTFTPDGSLEVVSNLSVQSPGAGQTGLEIRGRGRRAAELLATGNRDLGRAIVGQETLTQPENQFTWTVSNQGDLPSGALSVANDNPTEFEITSDTCDAATVPGGGACEVTIRFRPADVGARSGTIVVLDSLSNRTVSVVLTAAGERLAQLGQSCVNATCAAGECTGGVCCDRPCDGTCQVCSAAGVCSDQTAQEPCGSANGSCFGVNRCLLSNGQACGQGTDCGNGNCELRLNGQGPNDRICCQQDCDALGLQCNAQGQCQQPTLAEGAACGGAGDLPCGGGLECKPCLDGGNRCTEPDRCCGGCGPGYVCIDGERCGCEAGELDCGGGLCIQDRANACCPSTPDCPAALPNCDPADNLCKACVNAAQCAGSNRACNAGVCGCVAGNKDCGGGRCIPNERCCEECTGGRFCDGVNCRCPEGQTFVNGQCLLPQGAACTATGPRCVTGQCVDGVCCESTCQGVCTQCQAGTGRCVAPADDGACDAITCTTNEVCRVGVNINTNRCLAPGQCKTTANCTTAPAPQRTPCGVGVDAAICANSSACEVTPSCLNGSCNLPFVSCNGTNTQVDENACCDIPMPVGEVQDEEFFTSLCGNFAGGSGHVSAFCDSENDCPLGSICCLVDAGNFNSIACSTTCPETANALDPTGTGTYRVCSSPGGGATTCPGGRSCSREHPELDGWLFCEFP